MLFGVPHRFLAEVSRRLLKPQAVEGIRSIGDEFPQENFPARIEGVNHKVQNLLHFSLKNFVFFRHFSPRGISGVARPPL